MKRIGVILVSLGLVAGSVATAEAGSDRRVERTVKGSYGAYPAPVTGCARPVPIQPGSTLYFHIGLNNWLVTLHCPANRIKTTGTIRVTLSNLS